MMYSKMLCGAMLVGVSMASQAERLKLKHLCERMAKLPASVIENYETRKSHCDEFLKDFKNAGTNEDILKAITILESNLQRWEYDNYNILLNAITDGQKDNFARIWGLRMQYEKLVGLSAQNELSALSDIATKMSDKDMIQEMLSMISLVENAQKAGTKNCALLRKIRILRTELTIKISDSGIPIALSEWCDVLNMSNDQLKSEHKILKVRYERLCKVYQNQRAVHGGGVDETKVLTILQQIRNGEAAQFPKDKDSEERGKLKREVLKRLILMIHVEQNIPREKQLNREFKKVDEMTDKNRLMQLCETLKKQYCTGDRR